jgi:hypothetical protein
MRPHIGEPRIAADVVVRLVRRTKTHKDTDGFRASVLRSFSGLNCFVRWTIAYRDKKVVGVFVRFSLRRFIGLRICSSDCS